MKKTKEFDIRVCGDRSLIVLISDLTPTAASHKAKWLCSLIKEQKKVSDVSNVYAGQDSVTVIYDPCLASSDSMRKRIIRIISKNAKNHVVVIGADNDLSGNVRNASEPPAPEQPAPDKTKGGEDE